CRGWEWCGGGLMPIESAPSPRPASACGLEAEKLEAGSWKLIMRTPFIAANWKMYKTVHEAVVFVKECRSMVKDMDDVEIVVAPPFTALHAVAEAARNTPVGVAGQDVHWEKEGAFTGEVSAPMLVEAGADYVIIGHSERRRLFGETDGAVNRK